MGTHPPDPTTVNWEQVRVDVGLGKGQVRSFSDIDIDPTTFAANLNKWTVLILNWANMIRTAYQKKYRYIQAPMVIPMKRSKMYTVGD